MPTVTYTTHFPWDRANGPQENRPYSEVTLYGPNGKVRIWCLVDSGADLIQLNASFASNVGINLNNAVQKSVNTAAGGTTTVYEMQSVTFEVEGKTLTDICLFGANNVAMLGKDSFLSAFDVGLDVNGWMRT